VAGTAAISNSSRWFAPAVPHLSAALTAHIWPGMLSDLDQAWAADCEVHATGPFLRWRCAMRSCLVIKPDDPAFLCI
jgi:hypothetical protein